jgi:hypothetical protein
MGELEKEIKREEKQFEKFFHSKANIWMSVSILLAIVLIAVIFWPTGISANSAGEKIVALANAQGADAKLVSVGSKYGMYEVTIDIQGQKMPVYVSKDGKSFTTQMRPIGENDNASNAQTETPPSSDAAKDKCSQDAATRFGIDVTKIEALAFSTEGVNLLKAEEALNTKYGVSGSPSLVINGESREEIYKGTEATKSAICSAFKTLPSECKGVNITQEAKTKTDKPTVELFVMSYCPYGVRAETAVTPLKELFGNKIDLKIRFIVQVSGSTIESVQSLHGLTEAKENARQLAIVKLYPDKYWDYLTEFNNVCYGGGAASAGSC